MQKDIIALLPAWVRSGIRRKAGLSPSATNIPIRVVGDGGRPELVGKGPYHTDKHGTEVPSHKRVSAGIETTYHPSTRRIELGWDWLADYYKHQVVAALKKRIQDDEERTP